MKVWREAMLGMESFFVGELERGKDVGVDLRVLYCFQQFAEEIPQFYLSKERFTKILKSMLHFSFIQVDAEDFLSNYPHSIEEALDHHSLQEFFNLEHFLFLQLSKNRYWQKIRKKALGKGNLQDKGERYYERGKIVCDREEMNKVVKIDTPDKINWLLGGSVQNISQQEWEIIEKIEKEAGKRNGAALVQRCIVLLRKLRYEETDREEYLQLKSDVIRFFRNPPCILVTPPLSLSPHPSMGCEIWSLFLQQKISSYSSEKFFPSFAV